MVSSGTTTTGHVTTSVRLECPERSSGPLWVVEGETRQGVSDFGSGFGPGGPRRKKGEGWTEDAVPAESGAARGPYRSECRTTEVCLFLHGSEDEFRKTRDKDRVLTRRWCYGPRPLPSKGLSSTRAGIATLNGIVHGEYGLVYSGTVDEGLKGNKTEFVMVPTP